MKAALKKWMCNVLTLLAYGMLVTGFGFITSSISFAGTAPDRIYGNYVGTGKCTPDSPKPCTNTGDMDTIYLRHLYIQETDEQRQIREGYGLEKHDTRVSIRILKKYGHKCTFKQDMYWAGNHFKFFPKAPYPSKICKMELWEKNDLIVLKDPDNACSEMFCSSDRSTSFNGMQFKKGPDPLLEAYKTTTDAPPPTIFGKYTGTKKCALDERKSILCSPRRLKSSDFIEISHGALNKIKVIIDTSDTLLNAEAKWFNNHLVYIKQSPDDPGKPEIIQFWFKDTTVVASDIWTNHSGPSILGGLFKKQ